MAVEPEGKLKCNRLSARFTEKKKLKNSRAQCSHAKISMTTIDVYVF